MNKFMIPQQIKAKKTIVEKHHPFFRIRSFFFRKKAWLLGYDVCYKTPKHGQPKSGEAYCKRRRGHFGKHRTGSGYEFDRNCV